MSAPVLARFSGAVRRTRAVALKEFRHMARDPQVVLLALAMPLVLILVFGYGVSFDVERVPLVVVDRDRTAESRALARAFTAAGTFDLVAVSDDEAAVEPLFRGGHAKVALVIPPDFQRAQGRGDTATAQLLVDGTDNATATIALGYAETIGLTLTQRELPRGFDVPLRAEVRTLFNPALRSAVFIVPGLIVLVLVIVSVMLTALTVAREYERGSMEQLFATPVGRVELILGKLMPYFVLGLMQVLLVLVVGVYLFEVPLRGSVALIFVSASVFLLAELAFGLVISIVTRSQMVAAQVAAISTFLPALILSDFLFPIDNMPPPLRVVSSLLPPRYLVHALRAIMLRGNGVESVLPDLAAMGTFFIVMMVIATRKFRRTVA
jgi:ABC-2 type transport system permease protein